MNTLTVCTQQTSCGLCISHCSFCPAEDVCVPGCVVFFFPRVFFMFGCVSVCCVHTVCKKEKEKKSIYCLVLFLHGSTWLSHMNEGRTVYTVYIGQSVCMRRDGTLSLSLSQAESSALYHQARSEGHSAVSGSGLLVIITLTRVLTKVNRHGNLTLTSEDQQSY